MNIIEVRRKPSQLHPSHASTYMKLTHSELIKALADKAGAVIMGIETATVPKMRKTGNPFLGVVKTSRFAGMIGVNYEAAVNRRLEGQGDAPSFQSEAIWNGKGEYMIPGKIVRHKETGKLYLAVQGSDKQWDAFPATVKYLDGDKEIAYRDIESFLVKAAPSAKQASHGLSDNQQNVRFYALENVKRIHYQGETMEVVPD
jgi:hypothetical protein